MNVNDILIDDNSVYVYDIYHDENVYLISTQERLQQLIDNLYKENQLLKKQLKRQQQNFRMRYR